MDPLEFPIQDIWLRARNLYFLNQFGLCIATESHGMHGIF